MMENDVKLHFILSAKAHKVLSMYTNTILCSCSLKTSQHNKQSLFSLVLMQHNPQLVGHFQLDKYFHNFNVYYENNIRVRDKLQDRDLDEATISKPMHATSDAKPMHDFQYCASLI